MLHLFCVPLFSCCSFCALFSYCTFFVLYTFRVALFPCYTFFHVELFSCCTVFMFILSSCTFSLFASCCTLFMLHFSGIQASNFINKRLHHRCFPVKIVKFLRTYISKNTCVRLRQKVFSETLSMSKSHNMVILQRMNGLILLSSEAVIQRCSVKHVFLEILQNSQKNICARVSFLTKLQA